MDEFGFFWFLQVLSSKFIIALVVFSNHRHLNAWPIRDPFDLTVQF